MASFAQNQSRQFNKYVPETDTEVYGAALAKKSQEYQLGAKKVEQYNSIAGSIPVANNADQKYVQGIANKITSDLNQKIAESGDLSDQTLINSLGVMASTIYKDPKISTIISSTSKYKTENGKAGDSEKKNEGKDVANQYHYQSQVMPWVNSEEAGKDFNAKFLEFTDIQKGATDIALKIPEDERVVENNGLGNNNKQDIMSKTFKYRSPDKIRKALEGYLNTDAGAHTQAYVESEYKYKDYSKEDLFREKYNTSIKTLDHYQQSIDDIKQNLVMLGDASDPKIAKKRQELINQQKGLENEYSEKALDLAKKDYSSIEEASQDPDKKSALLTDLYKESFIQSKIDAYSYNKEGKTELQGKSGFEKQRELHNELLADTKENREAKQFEETLKDKQEARVAKALEKQQQQSGPILSAIPTKNANDSWNQVKTGIAATDAQLSTSELNVAYSVLQRAGGFAGLKQDRNGNISIANPNTSVNIKGKGLRTIPTEVYIYGGEYEHSGVKENYNGLIPDLMKSYRDGTYKSENTYSLSDIDRKSIADLSDLTYSQARKKEFLKSTEDEIMDETGTNKIFSQLNSHPLVINPSNSVIQNPFSRAGSQPGVSKPTQISGTDVVNYNNLSKDELTVVANNTEEQLAAHNPAMITKLKKLGLDYDKITAIQISEDPNILNLVQKHKDVSSKLNEAVEKQNLIATPGHKDWTGAKKEITKDREDKIKAYAVMLQSDPSVSEAGDKILKILTRKESDKDPNFSYTQDATTGDFDLAIEREGTVVHTTISAKQGANLGFNTMLAKQNKLEEELLWSKHHSTVPEGQAPNFSNGVSLGVVGNKDFRFHVIPEHTSHGLVNVLYFYGKNVKTGEEEPVQSQEIDDLHALGVELATKKEDLEKDNKNKNK